MFTQDSFGETAYTYADGFVLIHEDFDDNLCFICPQFATADTICLTLTSENGQTEITVFMYEEGD